MALPQANPQTLPGTQNPKVSAGVATLASYAILMGIAESDTWGGVAVAIAWGLAFALALEAITGFENIDAVLHGVKQSSK